MSRWFPERVRVLLSSARVVVARDDAAPSSIVVETRAAADEGPVWRPALDAVRRALESEAKRGPAVVDVVFESDLVRYQVTPWKDEFAAHNARAAYVAHGFAATYGEIARRWFVAESPGRFGHSSLAAAIDRELVEQLHLAAKAADLKLRGLCPALVPAYNAHRATLVEPTCWFVLLESRSMTLLLLRDGDPELVRSIGRDEARLDQCLDREWRLLGMPDERCVAYCFDAETNPETAREVGRWKAGELRLGTATSSQGARVTDAALRAA